MVVSEVGMEIPSDLLQRGSTCSTTVSTATAAVSAAPAPPGAGTGVGAGVGDSRRGNMNGTTLSNNPRCSIITLHDAPFTMAAVVPQAPNAVSALEREKDRIVSQAWIESQRPAYNNFSEFAMLTIQFAYVALFSLSFPLAPAIVMVKNLIDIRVGAWKLCRLSQRPVATKASGIGIWVKMLEVVSFLSILSNCALLWLTSSNLHYWFPNLTTSGKILLLFALEHALLMVKWLIHLCVPPVPASIQRHLRRDRMDFHVRQAEMLRLQREAKMAGYASFNEPHVNAADVTTAAGAKGAAGSNASPGASIMKSGGGFMMKKVVNHSVTTPSAKAKLM